MVLLYKRLLDEFRLPKGGVGPGESEADAAVREVAEETGFGDLAVVADLGEDLVEYRGRQGWVERRQRYYLLRLASFRREPRQPADARRFEVRWMDIDQALDQITYADERRVLKRAAAARSVGHHLGPRAGGLPES